MDNNLDQLKKRINNFKSKYRYFAQQNEPIISSKDSTNYSNGITICIELTASIIVGLIIGLFLDSMFHTKPYALVICLILSGIASLRLLFLKL